MKVLIDTNIILDDIFNRTPNVENAKKINRLIVDEIIGGYLTANTLTDIFYIVSKHKNEFTAKVVIKNLLLIFTIVSIDGDDCLKAINLLMGDFEDALIVVCAEKTNMDYIITNDHEFLIGTELSVSVISPVDFLLMIN